MLCSVSAPLHNSVFPASVVMEMIPCLSSEGRNSGTRPVRTAGIVVLDSSSAWRRFFKRAESRGSLFLSSRRYRPIGCHTLLHNNRVSNLNLSNLVGGCVRARGNDGGKVWL